METSSTIPSTPTRRHFDHDGVQLALHCWGDTGGHPLLFLHGFGQTAQAWQDSASALAKQGYYCVALDARGHGDSQWCPQGEYSIAQFERDLLALLAGQFDRRPTLVGASMGGLLGMACEADQPGLFAAMVLVDITPRWEQAGVNRILDFMAAKPDGFADLEEAAATVAAYLPHRADSYADRGADAFSGLRRNLRLGDDGRYRWHWDPRMLREARTVGEQQIPRLLAAAPKLALPLCLVSGGRSDVTSSNTIDEFLALVPHAQHVAIDDAHHMVAGDENDAFADAVGSFVAASAPTNHEANNQLKTKTKSNGESSWQHSV